MFIIRECCYLGMMLYRYFCITSAAFPSVWNSVKIKRLFQSTDWYGSTHLYWPESSGLLISVWYFIQTLGQIILPGIAIPLSVSVLVIIPAILWPTRGSEMKENSFKIVLCIKTKHRDFPGGPVVKNPPSNAGAAGLIPGRGTKIPHAGGATKPACAATTEPMCSGVRLPQLERSPRTATKDRRAATKTRCSQR